MPASVPDAPTLEVAPAPPRVLPLAASLWPAALALVAYLAWAPPVSGDKDSAEMALVLATGGAAHPTGYPVWVAVGHLFVGALHALGVGYPRAANAWSAVGGAAAVFALHALAARLVPPASSLSPRWRLGLAWIPAALFGIDPLWTYETTLAEVYSWHLAWVLGAALYFAWLWRWLGASAPGTPRRVDGHVLGWGLACGLGLAHHVTALAVAAPLSVALAWLGLRAGVLRARHAGIAVAGVLAPLASYAFVAWQAFHPAAWQWATLEPSWASIRDHVTGAGYRHYLGTFAPSPEQKILLARYLWPVLVPALLAHVAATTLVRDRGERALVGALLVAVGLGTAWAFSYGVPDPGSYFLAPLALSLATVVALGDAIAARSATVARIGAGAAVLAVLAPAPTWTAVAARRRDTFVALEEVIRGMWTSIPFDEAIVLWADDSYPRLVEYQVFLGEKPGIDVVNPWLIRQPVPAARFRARHGFDAASTIPEHLWTRAAADRSQVTPLLDTLARALNTRTPLPVLVADPWAPSVRVVRKP